jgi:hypothetical protein
VSGHHTILGVECLELMVLVITESGSAYAISELPVDQLLACLQRSHRSSGAQEPHHMPPQGHTTFSYASTTPESEHKRVRLKTVGSMPYDHERGRWNIRVLKQEIAVVDRKLASLLPFLSFCSLTLRAYSSVITTEPSRYS